jgi:hypothetical protein
MTQQTETPDPIKAIKRATLTEIRAERDDVHVQISDDSRGGYELKTYSHLDILLEAETITPDQFKAATIYWRIRDHLTQFINPLFVEIETEAALEEPVVVDEHTIDDPQTFMAVLSRQLPDRYRKAIDAACQAASGPKYILVHAFGEGLLKQAFDALEDAIPKTYEELKLKEKSAQQYEEQRKCLQTKTEIVDSRAVSYV